jgi:hypothetical protein
MRQQLEAEQPIDKKVNIMLIAATTTTTYYYCMLVLYMFLLLILIRKLLSITHCTCLLASPVIQRSILRAERGSYSAYHHPLL